MPAAAGHNANLSFGIESSFAGSAGDPQPFGGDANLTTAEGSNNVVQVFEPSSRDAAQNIEQHFEGSFSVEFTLTNPYFLPAVIAGGDGSYSGETPQTMTIYAGADGYFDRALVGCVVNSFSVSVETQGEATVTLDGAYADEDDTAAGSQPLIENRPLQFHDATLNLNGSALSLVQDVELSVENNIDLIWEIGSRFAVDFSPKQREVTLDWTDIVHNNDNLSRFYGGGTTPASQLSSTSDALLAFEDGNGNTVTFDVDGLVPETYSVDGTGDPEADLEGSISEIGATPSATSSGYTTNTT